MRAGHVADANDSGRRRHARHGHNDCEIAIGRKNWTFCGSDSGGRRAAAIYTLIETCKLNGLEPETYLRDILARIAEYPMKRIADLLRWAWKAACNGAEMVRTHCCPKLAKALRVLQSWSMAASEKAGQTCYQNPGCEVLNRGNAVLGVRNRRALRAAEPFRSECL